MTSLSKLMKKSAPRVDSLIIKPFDEDHTVVRLLSPERAISILQRHLGGSYGKWLDIVKDCSERSMSDNDDLALWSMIDGLQHWCDERDIYQIIAIQGAIQQDTSKSPFGVSFSASARLCVLYEEDCALRVYLDHTRDYRAKPLLSPEHARRLGMELLKIADLCETHRYDAVKKGLVPREDEDVAAAKGGASC